MATYPYEALDPESFQLFVQSLLVRVYPDLRCFPVAQPDGGRDAIVYFPEEANAGFAVFQVKFVRDPQALDDPIAWLLDTAKRELPKIAAHVPKGIKKYILVTNVKGSAHPETGSIDKLDAMFKENFSIPAECWWRDDLDRRLDNVWDLKWAYPQLMTGADFVRAIMEAGLTEDKQRRIAALQAYVRDQYRNDADVRFRQVELHNRLLDLYIDVPITPILTPASRQKQRRMMSIHRIVAEDSNPEAAEGSGTFKTVEGHPYYVHDEVPPVGAATFFLHPLVQVEVPFMVLEGAPGQGKSTISQYIAQVHRIRLLDERAALGKLPEAHQRSPVKLPFRIDLRDYASWTIKRNPFAADPSEPMPPQWNKSLESFIAAQISHSSGGTGFDVDDLLAVWKISSVILILDGLDEVADIGRRAVVVQEVVAGSERLRQNAASLQVIVTSRPAAFANSPGLPDDVFPYFQLESVTRPLIDAYTDKWLKARNVAGKEASNVRRIVREKLDEPHLRDLARNPMQLAILLSLVHTRGESLPDKRTALYDSYTELFFSRESEKSTIVRQHRELLINIHRFLAWEIQSLAEVDNSNGRISEQELRGLVIKYLESEGHDHTLAARLFTGMVERVVALVSRVQGTYEFEVQPLREYFAARYLYETAPYSPPGKERPGTLPDRFDALSHNFYWLNVTRFYAGCFSKGELPALIDRLRSLTTDPEFRYLSYPRTLCATLLGDWVFSQYPRCVRDVVELVIDGIGLRYVTAAARRRAQGANALILPEGCGKNELVRHCFSLLAELPPLDYSIELCDVLRANAQRADLSAMWHARPAPADEYERGRWLHVASMLGVLPSMEEIELGKYIPDILLKPRHIDLLLQARHSSYLEQDEMRFEKAVAAILDSRVSLRRVRDSPSILYQLSQVLDPVMYRDAVHHAQPVPMSEHWRQRGGQLDRDEPIQSLPHFELANECGEFYKLARRLARKTAIEWATSLAPWDELVERGRDLWGDRWSLVQIANAAATIRAPGETCKDTPELLDHDASLCRRLRYARLRGGHSKWWRTQHSHIASASDRMLWLLAAGSWVNDAVMIELSTLLDDETAALSTDEWVGVEWGIRLSSFRFPRRLTFSVAADNAELTSLQPRAGVLFGRRMDHTNRTSYYVNQQIDYFDDDHIVLEYCMEVATQAASTGALDWEAILPLCKHAFARNIESEMHIAQRGYPSGTKATQLPPEVARQINSEPESYPGFLVAAAVQALMGITGSKVVPVGVIARSNHWFTDPEGLGGATRVR